MNRCYTLSSCSTSKRILREVNAEKHCTIFDIKSTPLTAEQIDELKQLAGSYELIFNKRAKKYTALGLKFKNLQEADFRTYLLQDYTFLKRPVFIINQRLYCGNAQKTIAAIQQALQPPINENN